MLKFEYSEADLSQIQYKLSEKQEMEMEGMNCRNGSFCYFQSLPPTHIPNNITRSLRYYQVKKKNADKMASLPSFPTCPSSLSKPSSVLSSYYTEGNCCSNSLRDSNGYYE